MLNTKTKLVAASVVALAATTIGIGNSAAQRRAGETITRAPELVVTAPTITGSVTVQCQIQNLGPEAQQVTQQRGQALGGMISVSTTSTQARVVSSSECGSFGDNYATAMRSAIESSLRSMGRSISWVPSGGELNVSVSLSATSTMIHAADRTDGEGDSTCADACGTASCKRYTVALAVQEDVNLTVPAYQGAPQSFSGAFPNGGLGFEFIDCNNSRAESRHGEFSNNNTWGQVFGRVNSEISMYINPQLGMHTDSFDARVANVRRSRAARPAFDDFESGNYAAASAGFSSAFDQDGASLNSSNQADLLYNAALSALFAGDFVIAREFAERAFTIDNDGRLTRLLEETGRRQRDAQIFEELGLPQQF